VTDFHDYNEPDQGAERWHVPLNENFREIDADIEIRDTEANRGDYEPKEGAKYFETDTGDIYLGDGANWQRQSIASGAETSVSDDGSEVVNDVTDIDLTDGYFDVTNPGGSAVDVSVTDNSIDTDPIDASIEPTWTGQHRFDLGIDVRGDVVDDTTTVWDSTNGYVPQTSLENDTVTVNSGNALEGGGDIALGGSTTLAVGQGSIRTNEIDESIAPFWSSRHVFQDGIDTRGVIEDGSTTIWDSANGYVPQARLENDSVTVTAGNALTGGGNTALGGSTSLSVGQSAIATDEIDESIAPTWTSTHTFAAGLLSTDDLQVSDGNGLLVGHDTKQATDPNTVVPENQLLGNSSIQSGLLQARFSNNSAGPHYYIGKSRGTLGGANSAVQQGDVMGYVDFVADDGTNLETVATRISTSVDGPVSSNTVPSALSIETTGLSGNRSEAIAINSNQDVSLSSGNLFMQGGTINSVGGATDANSGAIRLANSSGINARNSADTDNFGIEFTSNDTVAIDTDITDGTNIIYDYANSWVPQTSLENDSVTVNSGVGLKGGGSVSLGSSTTLDIEPGDFAGTLLSDDGSDNLQVDEGAISHDGIDQTTVSANDHHAQDHAERHGFGNNDELSTRLRYRPQAEPPTPSTGVVRWYDQNSDSFKAKFDDGTSVTLAQK